MAKGGKRRGAGRPVGSKNKATLAKALVEEEYRRYMLQETLALWRSQRERAIGAYVLIVKTKDGVQRVTDPDAIEKILSKPAKRGQTYWLIEARAPERHLPKENTTRQMVWP